MQKFLEKFFLTYGAKVKNNQDLMTVELTEELTKEFGKPVLNLVFSPKKLTEKSELVTHGGFIPSKILLFLQEKGQKVVVKEVPKFSLTKSEVEKMVFSSRKFEVKNKKNIIYELVFNYKVIFVSDEKTEELYSVKIDSENKISVSKISIFAEDFFGQKEILELSQRDSGVISENEINEKFLFASKELEKVLAKRIAEIENQLLNRLVGNLKRIKNYYSEQIETFSKSVVPDLQAKAVFLKQELERKKVEEINFHSLKVDLVLLSFQILEKEKIDFLLKVGEKEVVASLDCSSGKFDLPKCEGCKTQTLKFETCEKNHFLCENCHPVCSSCGKETCVACGTSVCTFDGKVLCKKCEKTCDSCGLFTCKTHSHFSEIGNQIVCENCLVVCKNCGAKVSVDFAFGCSVSGEGLFCENCLNTCRNCLKKYLKKFESECSFCGQVFCEDCSQKCSFCGLTNCQLHLSNCVECGKSLCKTHAKKDLQSQDIFCEKHFEKESEN
ncbi:hypothetical protein IT568_05490 [bacterium]|nr:hypothetical protein [bacterium]